LRNIHSSERTGQNKLKNSEESDATHFERKKFFRHQKKYKVNKQNGDTRRYEIPVHEFEEKFEVRPPPKDNVNATEADLFKNWFFRDSSDDLEAMESQAYIYNNTDVSKVKLVVNIFRFTLLNI
jgi:hypothetical protein